MINRDSLAHFTVTIANVSWACAKPDGRTHPPRRDTSGFPAHAPLRRPLPNTRHAGGAWRGCPARLTAEHSSCISHHTTAIDIEA